MRQQREAKSISSGIAARLQRGLALLALCFSAVAFAHGDAANTLSPAEFDSIVAEARVVARATDDTHDMRQWPDHWQHLDRAKLAALWSAPQSAEIEDSTRIVLVEQAALWDLFRFDRPSEAAALWARVWPRKPAQDASGNPNQSGWTFDDQWSDRAIAMLVLFQCYPEAAWSAEGEAPVWAVENAKPWSNGRGGFGPCVQNIAQAHAPAVTAVLQAMFTRELHDDGCSRGGPDSCLAIYETLQSLDPLNPRLPTLLQRMEPAFALDTPVVLPDAPAATSPPNGKKRSKSKRATETESLRAPDAELERRLIFIADKLPLVLAHPDAWPVGELDQTLQQAVALTLLSSELDRRARWHALRSKNAFDNPWRSIDASASARTDALLMAAGAANADKLDCARHDEQLMKLPAAFARGYTIETIRRDRAECSDVGHLQLAEVFRTVALEKEPANAQREAAIFAPIAAELSRDGKVRSAALDIVAPFCDASTHERRRDPWQLCDGVTAREVAQAVVRVEAEKAARQAAAERERIEAARRDPYDCPPDTTWKAVQALAYAGDHDFWSGQTAACRLKPDDPSLAIVALTYVEGDQHTGVASAPADDPGLTLDLLIVHAADGNIVARLASSDHIDSDGVRFNGLGIDTANYALAPDVRAFGVLVSHAAGCYQCLFRTTDLKLYAQRGAVLAPLVAITIDDVQGEAETTDCDAVPTRNTRTVSVGSASSAGLADLRIRSKVEVLADELSEACKARGKEKPVIANAVLRYDGQTYREPAGFSLLMP